MIELTDLRFRYPRDSFELHVPQLQIPAGQHLAITGRSGCGKTTLLNLLAGILIPESGTLSIEGRKLSQESDRERREYRRKHIGLVFQDFQLIEYLSVIENVLVPCRISATARPGDAERQRAASLLQQMGLRSAHKKSVQELSQGERQRVAICRALLLKPTLLLADEPTGNLDPRLSMQIVDLLLNYSQETGATFVMVTHDHTLLSRFQQVIPFDRFLPASAVPPDLPADFSEDRGHASEGENA